MKKINVFKAASFLTCLILALFSSCEMPNSDDKPTKSRLSYWDPYGAQKKWFTLNYTGMYSDNAGIVESIGGFNNFYQSGQVFGQLSDKSKDINYTISEVPTNINDLGVIFTTRERGVYRFEPKLSFLPQFEIQDVKTFDGMIKLRLKSIEKNPIVFTMNIANDDILAGDVIDGKLPFEGDNSFNQLRTPFHVAVIAIVGAASLAGTVWSCVYARNHQHTECQEAYEREQNRSGGLCNFRYTYGACGGTCDINCR